MGDSHGRHIKVVGKAGNVVKLGELATVKAFLSSLVAALGMRGLGELSFDVPLEIAKLNATPFEDEGGITGVVVLSTSHCSIHTWPLRNHYVLDVYSCRDFPGSVVVDKLVEFFGSGPTHLNDVSHTLRTPEEVKASPSGPGEVTSVLDPLNLARHMRDREDYKGELSDMNNKDIDEAEREKRRKAREKKREDRGDLRARRDP